MDLLEGVQIEVARQARAVLRVLVLDVLHRYAVLDEPPVAPAGAAEPGPVEHEVVAGTPVFPGGADPVRDRARGHAEVLRRRPLARVAVEPELVLGGQLLKRRVLPAKVGAGRQRPGQQTLLVAFGAGVVEPIGRRHRDREEVDARVERPDELRPLQVAGSQHAGEEDGELRVLAAAELEVEVVDPEDRQREGVRRVERDAHRHRPGPGRGPLADHALVPLLDVVAQPAIGLAIHDALAPARPGAELDEAGIVDLEVGEGDALLDQQVAPGNHHDLARVEPGEQEDRRVADRGHRLVGLDLLVRHDRRRQPRLHGLHAHAREAAALDPDGAAIERLAVGDRIEADHVAVVPADALGAGQPVAVVAAEPQLQRQRQHFLGLQQRERRPIAAPLRAVHRERQLLPLDAILGHVVAVLRHHVVPGIGHGGPEVLLHPGRRHVAVEQPVLGPLLLLVARDDLFHRQLPLGGDAAPIDEDLAGAFVEVHQHRAARLRHSHAHPAVLRAA